MRSIRDMLTGDLPVTVDRNGSGVDGNRLLRHLGVFQEHLDGFPCYW